MLAGNWNEGPTPKPIEIRGTVYPSHRAAAKALSVSPKVIRQAIERGTVDRIGFRKAKCMNLDDKIDEYEALMREVNSLMEEYEVDVTIRFSASGLQIAVNKYRGSEAVRSLHRIYPWVKYLGAYEPLEGLRQSVHEAVRHVALPSFTEDT